ISLGYLESQYNTGYYGNLTESAVKAFQTAHSIESLGIVGPQTRAALNAAKGNNQTSSAQPVSAPTPSTEPQSNSTSTPTTFTGTFTRNLTIGSTGSDVKALQEYLNSKGFTISSTGPGSPGNESDYFGALTQSALSKFQSSVGISPASGYFGSITRAYVENH
ncbi:MAG: peptidoglycan-binding protein, partial [Patescibacteria group bacterium]|nr:peptidoglycan-binding protein [Patescibacteria group bacterium]